MQNTACSAAVKLQDAVRQLPSTMAQLVFLSGLRDLNCGNCTPTASDANATEVDQILRSMHEQTFSTWLNYRLEEQKADLDLYFSGIDCEKTTAVRTWRRLDSYRSIIPASATQAERLLFLSDLELLLYLMAHDTPSFASEVSRQTPDAGLLTADELSAWLGVSRAAVRLWVARHKMPAVRVGRQWRFALTDVCEWFKARRRDKATSPARRSVASVQGTAPQAHTRPCALSCSKRGIFDLSPREREVLALIGQGKGTKEIAALMSISESTVSEHRKRISRRLDLHSTVELAACGVGQLSGICRRHEPLRLYQNSTMSPAKGTCASDGPSVTSPLRRSIRQPPT